jgi:hypothetical protein
VIGGYHQHHCGWWETRLKRQLTSEMGRELTYPEHRDLALTVKRLLANASCCYAPVLRSLCVIDAGWGVSVWDGVVHMTAIELGVTRCWWK